MPYRSRLLALAFLLSGGCAADGGPYPSLARRAAEGTGFAEPAAVPAVPVAADPALDAQIGVIRGDLERARGAFDTAAGRAEARVGAARGSAVGSDPWLDAQTALAELDVLRAATGDSVGTLEDLAAERAAALAAPYPALDAAVEAARAAVAAQRARIDALTARLPAA